jgi:hypothetical protein
LPLRPHRIEWRLPRRGQVLNVIPVDGLIARGDYEHEFTLHQFIILPKFKITQFDKIKMASIRTKLEAE